MDFITALLQHIDIHEMVAIDRFIKKYYKSNASILRKVRLDALIELGQDDRSKN